MTARWTRSITTVCADPRVRVGALTAYYLAILAAVMLLASRGLLDAPAFVYQGF